MEGVVLTALQAHRSQIVRTLDPAQQAAALRRDSERLGVEPHAWTALRRRNPDLVVFREIHEAISSMAKVRRADRDGQWTLANARPGHLRSQPQSFRAGDRVEPAWDHTTLARRVAEVIAMASVSSASDAVARAAELVWTLVRAQPFLGDNERAALALASMLLARFELPVLSLDVITSDSDFFDALAANTSEPLATYVRRSLWDEALELAEWLRAFPSGDDRWSLAAEHTTLAAMRERARDIDPEQLVQVVEHAVVQLTNGVASGDSGAVRWTPTATHAERLRVAIASARRGRHLCIHRAVHEVRIRIDGTGLDAVVVAGSAGRGLTGAAGLHIAIEIADVPPTTGRASPGLLLVPGESRAEQEARFAEWSPFAIQRALRDSPIYGCALPRVGR